MKSSAIRIQLSPEDPVSKNVSHSVMFVSMDDKRFFLERFIRENEGARVIVFVRTRVRAERVVKAMGRAGIESAAIHGDKDQADRTQVMKRFREGECDILVATDVSARGIDVPDVSFVVNYDLPTEPENYVHRVGRTGRGVRKGLALSFCSPEERERLGEIEDYLKREVEVIRITKKEYAETVEPPREDLSVLELIEENESWEKQHKKKNKKRK